MTGTMFKYSSVYCREHVREQHVSVIKNRSLLVGLINYKPICIFNDTFSVEQNNSNRGTNKSIHMQYFCLFDDTLNVDVHVLIWH